MNIVELSSSYELYLHWQTPFHSLNKLLGCVKESRSEKKLYQKTVKK